MGTCRTPPGFSFCSRIGPLHFLVRNCGQCYSSILKAVRNQLPAFHSQILRPRWGVIVPTYLDIHFHGETLSFSFVEQGLWLSQLQHIQMGRLKIHTADIIFSEFKLRFLQQKRGFNNHNLMVVMTEIIIRNVLYFSYYAKYFICIISFNLQTTI